MHDTTQENNGKVTTMADSDIKKARTYITGLGIDFDQLKAAANCGPGTDFSDFLLARDALEAARDITRGKPMRDIDMETHIAILNTAARRWNTTTDVADTKGE